MSEYRIRRKRAPLRAELMDSQVASRDLNVAFAKRLQKAMDAKGWSQADLARQASVFLEPKGGQARRDHPRQHLQVHERQDDPPAATGSPPCRRCSPGAIWTI